MRPHITVLNVQHNNRKRELAMELTGRGTLTFPYHRCDPPPTRDDLIRELYVDDELGQEGVTYVLASGKVGSVVADMVVAMGRSFEAGGISGAVPCFNPPPSLQARETRAPIGSDAPCPLRRVGRSDTPACASARW